MTEPAVHPPRHGQPFTGNPPLTVRDLARETGHSRRSIQRWIATYRIKPAGQISRARYYWLSDILTAERDTRHAQLAALRHAHRARVS